MFQKAYYKNKKLFARVYTDYARYAKHDLSQC